jgi:hypothetical protein
MTTKEIETKIEKCRTFDDAEICLKEIMEIVPFDAAEIHRKMALLAKLNTRVELIAHEFFGNLN